MAVGSACPAFQRKPFPIFLQLVMGRFWFISSARPSHPRENTRGRLQNPENQSQLSPPQTAVKPSLYPLQNNQCQQQPWGLRVWWRHSPLSPCFGDKVTRPKSSGFPVHLCFKRSGLWLTTVFMSISDLGEILFIPPTSNSACSVKIFLVHLPSLDTLAAVPQVCCPCLG